MGTKNFKIDMGEGKTGLIFGTFWKSPRSVLVRF